MQHLEQTHPGRNSAARNLDNNCNGAAAARLEPGFAAVPVKFFADRDIADATVALRVFPILCASATSTGLCGVAVDELGRRLGLSAATIKSAIDRLVRCGWVERITLGRAPVRYRVRPYKGADGDVDERAA